MSLGELTAAVKKLGNNKSPGPDGLSAEFLQAFWELLGQDLLDALNSAQHKLKVRGSHNFKSLNEGTQTILYKNKGEREKLKNYRPI